MIIGLDLGYGYVKMTTDGQVVQTFPSVVGSGGKREFAGMFGSTRGLDDMAVEVDGKTYYVGELAVAESFDASRAIDRNKTHHEATRILIASAILLANPAQDEEIRLYTGLPLEYVREQKDDFRQTLETMRFTAKGVSGPFQGAEKEIRFETVRVLPQAIGAAYAALMDSDGRPRYPELAAEEDPLALIDIGYRTTDFTVFQVRPRMKVLEDPSGTVNVGASTVYNMVCAAYPEIPERDVEKAAAKGRIWINGRTLEIAEEVKKVKASVVKTVTDEIKHRWGDRISRIRAVFLAGGGARLLGGELRHFHPDVRLVDRAQGANAIGFFRMGQMAETKAPPVPVPSPPPKFGITR